MQELLDQNILNVIFHDIPYGLTVNQKKSSGAFTGKWKLLNKELASELKFSDFVKNFYFLLKSRL